MSRDAQQSVIMDTTASAEAIFPVTRRNEAPRMQYRSRPVSVAVDPISLVISECISITSAIQKHARSPHSSVSAILGGNPNSINLGGVNVASKVKVKGQSAGSGTESTEDLVGNSRWGLRGQKGKSMQDNPMITGFGQLRHDLSGVKDVKEFDAPALLAPFLLVIQSKGTAAPITILALGALRKFLAYGFVCAESPRFPLAMQSLAGAVTHCQFDISDSAQGEVVLLMILNLMEDMMSGPGGDILSDESVCDMMGRGLAICSQPRFSPVLRRTAEAAMVRMCQIIFEDIKHLEVEAGEDSTALDDLAQDDRRASVHMEATQQSASVDTPEMKEGSARPSMSEERAPTESASKEPEPSENNENGEDEKPKSESSDETESVDLRPYSLPSVRELFRVLVNFLNPNDRHHTDTMRVMALRIIHVAFEVSGPFIARHPALATIAEDKLCSYLFQLVRSDNMAVLQESLIVAGTLLATCRPVLKLQQELYLSYLVACLHPTVPIPREPGIDPALYAGIPETPKLVKPPPSQVTSGRSTPVAVKDRQKLGLEGGARKPDARQAMVENIGVLSRMPTFIAELFVNYDCDADRADLCEDMIGLLSRNALPDSATWSTTSVPPLCLDALLRYIQFVAERLDQYPVTEGLPDAAELREKRRRKKIIIKGTSKFNEKPKEGLGYLEAQGILRDAKDPMEVAQFLKGTSRVSKSVLGDFLSKRGNEEILKAFMAACDFSGKRIDEALRSLLESFRLPGEAPLIATIVECFSEQYFETDVPDEVANKDAVFILCYAIILLNTDQHNKNLKAKRMTQDDFARNLRGQNDGKNFSPEYLKDIYNSIKNNEIILPDEHDNQHGFDYAWRELLVKTESSGDLIICDTNIYDGDMFAVTWKPIVSTLAYVFVSATDDAVFARIVTGFDECARIATKYNNSEALDQIVYCLSHITTLASSEPFNTSLNTEVQVGDNSVMVSELAVKLGRDFRAQLAMLVLFRVVTGSEHLIRRSWKHVIRIWINLFGNSLSPQFTSPTLSALELPPIPLQPPSKVIDRDQRASESGFFSAFTSYISSYAADEPPEPSEEELESTLCTVDCIKSCQLEEVFANVAKLSPEAAMELVEGLLEQLPEDDSTTIIGAKEEAAATAAASGQTPASQPHKYDPSVSYILEFCTIIATRDSLSMELMGQQVFDQIQVLLRESSQWHPITVSRAVYYALQILKVGYDHEIVNVTKLLHYISSLPQEVLAQTSGTILSGLATCTNEPGPLRSQMMTSPGFWATLRVLANSPESAAMVFDILDKGTTGSPPAIIADNYVAAVALLNQFASAANPLASPEARSETERRQSDSSRVVEVKADQAAIDRGCRAIQTLQNMTSRIPQLMQQSHLESSEAWSAYWLPIFQSLMSQCTNPSREVRQLAFSGLQRTLLSADLTNSDPQEWTAIFSKVLFPLILTLLKPEVFSTDKEGMSDMRVQSASLLCKVFLQYMVLLSAWEGMLDLWVKVIEIMDRLMNSGQGDSLEEAVRENLKNVVLYMVSSGTLVPPAEDPSRQKLWDETWKRVDRFLPDLRADITGPAPERKSDITNETKTEPAKEVEVPERPKEVVEEAAEKTAEAEDEEKKQGDTQEVQQPAEEDKGTEAEHE